MSERGAHDSTPPRYQAHPTALVESADVGEGTRIWAFCHVLPGARIGAHCNLGDHCYVEGGVWIGDHAVIKNGVSLWEGVTLESHVFVGPNAAFTNDRIPRVRALRADWERSITLVREGASVGANATVVAGVTIGRYALVGAGAVVTRDIPDFCLALGNPARPRGFVCRCGLRLTFIADQAACRCGRGYRREGDRVEEEP